MLPKLVRDKIPRIINSSGKNPVHRVASSKELNGLLIRKLEEEVSEFESSPCLEEAADIYEVFLAVLKNWKMDIKNVQMVAGIKKKSRGAFEKGIILEKVIEGSE